MSSSISRLHEEIESDEMRWAVFSPPDCSAGDELLIQVWLYAARQEEKVLESARAADAGTQLRAKLAVKTKLSRGNELLVMLKAEGLRIDEPEARLTWYGKPASVNFVVGVPEQRPASNQIPRATLYLNDFPLGWLGFTLRAVEDARPLAAPRPPQQVVARPQRAYICYAHADRVEVLKRAQGIQAAGVAVFMDKISFDSGEEWEGQVRLMIGESDLFCLFWSKAAAESQWVMREIELALQHQEDDPGKRPVIVPIPLTADAPRPPASLATLHFEDPLLHYIDAQRYREKK